MASDTLNAFQDWQQYLRQEDFEYLIQYIENIKYGIPNHEMIILLGPPCTGKTKLIDEIYSYLAPEFCEWGDVHELIYEENIKPFILLGQDYLFDTHHNYKYNRNVVNSLINFIKFGISFITAANDLNRTNTKFLEHSRIIEMTHIFTPNT
jgi:tRNA A37 threonylcarbamoyladenosine dehydratase